MLSKKDLINQMMGLMACVRNNSILPVVYPELDGGVMSENGLMSEPKENGSSGESEKEKEESKQHLNQPAMNVYAEFLRPEHERARALSKAVVLSRDQDR